MLLEPQRRPPRERARTAALGNVAGGGSPKKVLQNSLDDLERTAVDLEEERKKGRRLEKELREARAEKRPAQETPQVADSPVTYEEMLSNKRCREDLAAVCGFPNRELLEGFFNLLDSDGYASSVHLYHGAHQPPPPGEWRGGRRRGKPPKLQWRSQVFFTLYVLRTESTVKVASVTFRVDESTASR